MKNFLPHIQIHQKVWGIVEDIISDDVVIVSLYGDLIRVVNQTKRRLRLGQRIQLKVVSLNPLEFRLMDEKREAENRLSLSV